MKSHLRHSLFGCVLALLSATSILSAAVEPATLLNDPTVKAALAAVERNEPETLNLQARLTEIPAPPFNETARGLEVKRLFEQLGLKEIRVDKVGNVIGVRPGALAKPNIVVAAHLDTVFPEGTDVRVKRDGKFLRAPGIGDDGRGLAAMLSVIRALDEGGVAPRRRLFQGGSPPWSRHRGWHSRGCARQGRRGARRDGGKARGRSQGPL